MWAIKAIVRSVFDILLGVYYLLRFLLFSLLTYSLTSLHHPILHFALSSFLPVLISSIPNSSTRPKKDIKRKEESMFGECTGELYREKR